MNYSTNKMPFLHSSLICFILSLKLLFLWPTILASINQSIPPTTFNELVLNPEKLDLLLHNAAIFALLKAKAHSLTKMPNFPKADSLLYGRCSLEAKSSVQLAKCVVPLLNARDRMRHQKALLKDFGQNNGEAEEEMDLVSRFSRWLMEAMAKLGIGKGNLAKKNGKGTKKMLWPMKNGKINKIEEKEWKKTKMFKKRKYSADEERREIVTKMRRLRIRKLHLCGRRQRRAMIIIDPIEAIRKGIFQPNARQMKRMKIAQVKREGKKVEEKPMDLLNGKNVPWFMEPLGQLMRMAKAMMEGKKLVGKKKKKIMEKRRRQKIKGKTMRKRGTQKGNENAGNESNIDKLRRIQHFYEIYEYCQKHLAEMGETNSRYIGQLMPSNSPPILFQMGRSQMENLADELQQVLANYSFQSFPILSPRLLSLFPGSSSSKLGHQLNLLSPTMFSFHREGLFSLPSLFGMISTSEADMVELLDLFLELSGASRVLDKILTEVEPKMEELKQKLYPTLLKLEEMEKRWEKVRASLNEGQRSELDRRGFTLLNVKQFGRLYGQKRAREWTVTDEFMLEEDIRRMAEMDNTNGRGSRNRPKRYADNSTKPEQLHSLRPFLYTNKLRQNAAVAVNGVVLSPRAFATTLTSPNFMWLNVLSPVAFAPSILSPRAAVLTVLSPTAFTANILNPNTLWTEVLSPKFFHSNVLSPRALASIILSPRTMLGEVLSPKMVEFRLLNPGTFYAGVLTPNLLKPGVLSPNNFGVTVLSPNILSPTILSRGNFTVQVLSPSIMSDDVSIEQFWRGEWQEPENTTIKYAQ